MRVGAMADPAGREGLARMTADMLDEGAGGKDALALADAVDFLGAQLETSAGWDASTVRLRVPVARLAEALPLLADVALRPEFPEKRARAAAQGGPHRPPPGPRRARAHRRRAPSPRRSSAAATARAAPNGRRGVDRVLHRRAICAAFHAARYVLAARPSWSWAT